MGIVGSILGILFGGGRNAITETAEVFRVNAEASDARAVELQSSALEQLAAEFEIERKGWFDRFIDGLNRIPRPALALGTLGLFIAAMVDPVWFSQRMQGLALVPEPLWWLLGAIVSFYFGARHQVKSQQFQRSIAATMARTPRVLENIASLRRLNAKSPGVAGTKSDASLTLASLETEDNPALEDWQRSRA
ncbi:MAG: holin family protein [Pseudomonadota bacterium]